MAGIASRSSFPTSPVRCQADRLLPWLLDAISHVPANRIVIVNGTGSHRANTPAELSAMVGEDVLRRYRVVNHDSHDPSTLALAGSARTDSPCC